MAGPRECGVLHMALLLYTIPTAWTNIGGLTSFSGCNMTWPRAVLQIQSTEVQMRWVLVQQGGEIRKERNEGSALFSCTSVAALLQQHCSSSVPSKVCAYTCPAASLC